MKALKIIGIVIAVVVGLMLYSVHWMEQINEDKWQKYSTAKHCKPISADQYQCDSAEIITKRKGSAD